LVEIFVLLGIAFVCLFVVGVEKRRSNAMPPAARLRNLSHARQFGLLLYVPIALVLTGTLVFSAINGAPAAVIAMVAVAAAAGWLTVLIYWRK
jgi:hypothetical protein